MVSTCTINPCAFKNHRIKLIGQKQKRVYSASRTATAESIFEKTTESHENPLNKS